MKKIALAAAAISTLFVGTASGADLAVKALHPAPPPCIWCGFYVGGNIGYGFGKTDVTGNNFYTGNLAPALTSGTLHTWSLSDNLNGVLGGGQVGYNTQFDHGLVVGIEADIQGTNLKSSGIAAIPLSPNALLGLVSNSGLSTTSDRLDWFGTVRGRLGFTAVAPNVLLYGTAGVAYGHVKGTLSYADTFPGLATISGVGQFNETRVGWTAGAGVEWKPSTLPRWSFKAEYLYTDLGSVRGQALVNTPTPFFAPGTFPVFVASQSSLYRFNTVRVGVNYHFGGPIVAKY